MGADTILSMTIIAWAFLPVNRNAVPVCVICVPIWCHLKHYTIEINDFRIYNNTW